MSEPFSDLFEVLQHIEQELSEPGQKKPEVIRQLAALRARADEWIEQWLILEDRIADLCERFGLDLELWEEDVFEEQESGEVAADSSGLSVVWHIPPHLDGDTMVRAFRRGIGFFDLWMYEDAVRELETVVHHSGDFPVARLYLALGYVAQGRGDAAEPHLQFLLSTERSPWIQTSAYHARAHVLAEQGKWEEAVEDLIRAVEGQPGIPLLYYNLGVCLSRVGRHAEALLQFSKVVELDPHDEEGWIMGIRALQQLGRWKQAADWAFHGYWALPKSWRLGRELAVLLDYMGHLDGADMIWRRLVRMYPLEAAIWTGVGWTRWRTGDRHGAKGAWKKAISLEPCQGQAVLYLGWAALEEGQWEEARRYLSCAENYPGIREAARLALGWIDREEGRVQDAESKWSYVAQGGTGIWRRWAKHLLEQGLDSR